MIGWERIQGGKANLKRWVLSFERNVETDNELYSLEPPDSYRTLLGVWILMAITLHRLRFKLPR